MNRQHWCGLLVAAACLTLLGACSKDHAMDKVRNPLDPVVTGLQPPIPRSLDATVGNRRVELSWEISDSTEAASVVRYRVYRRELDKKASVADSADVPPLTLRGLVNGVQYHFSVSALMANGLEGKRSDELSATPGVFSVVIENGRERVATAQVRLSLVAPEGTEGMRIANQSDLSGTPTQAFATVTSWQLTGGDGPKTVYVQFVDAEGNISQAVSDEVLLDTQAQIDEVTFSPTEVQPGQTIRFELDAGEPHGTATVRLGSGGRRLTLRDDGSYGDPADDGVYVLDYLVEEDLILVDGLVTGSFTDEAGNQASDRVASRRLTIRRPPDAVTLNPPSNVTETSVSLSWTQSLSNAFSAYRVYRGQSENVMEDPRTRLLTSLSSPSQTTYEDRTEIEENRTYYYLVQVVDDFGITSDSNVRSVLIPDKPPAAVTLNAPSSVGETALLLGWTRNNDRDFARYEIRRSAVAGVGSGSALVDTVGEAAQTSFLDQGLVENTSYYYRVFVVDLGGISTGSNEISPKTANRDPEPVDLAAPVEDQGAQTPTVQLSWSISTAHDFKEYRVYRDTSPAVGTGSTLIRTIADSVVTSYTDVGLTDNTRYYFRVFVFDDAGGQNGSNERVLVTKNRPPRPVTLNVGQTTTTSISLSWTQSTNADFNAYELRRGVRSDSFPTIVATFSQKEQTAHTMFFAESDSVRYFFKIATYDKSLESEQRLRTDSNVVSARIARP